MNVFVCISECVSGQGVPPAQWAEQRPRAARPSAEGHAPREEPGQDGRRAETHVCSEVMAGK